MIRAGIAAAVVGGLALAGAGPASGSQIRVENGTVLVTGAPASATS